MSTVPGVRAGLYSNVLSCTRLYHHGAAPGWPGIRERRDKYSGGQRGEETPVGLLSASEASIPRRIKFANQLRALNDGYSSAITAEIARLEQRLTAVRERLKAADPAAAKLRIRDTRRSVESQLRNLSALWEGEPRLAREEIAKHVGKITLRAMLRTYVATGVWNWFGVPERAAAMVVPGARIELATPAFSGRRSTTELPRHLLSRNCMGCDAIVSIRLV